MYTKLYTNDVFFQIFSCSQQKIAIKLAYIGWDYQGFASQDNTDKTIEVRKFNCYSISRFKVQRIPESQEEQALDNLERQEITGICSFSNAQARKRLQVKL